MFESGLIAFRKVPFPSDTLPESIHPPVPVNVFLSPPPPRLGLDMPVHQVSVYLHRRPSIHLSVCPSRSVFSHQGLISE